MRHLLLLILLVTPSLALAQTEDDAAGKVTTLSRHIMEMRELLAARDSTIRDAAIETALNDPSASVRGMAIFYALRRYEQLPLQFALPAGSSIQQENLPSLTLERVKWTEDGRSLSASGNPCGGYQIKGQITGDRLRLQFYQICISGELSGATLNQPGVAPRATQYRACGADLAPTRDRDALIGTLRCPGLPVVLPLSLPLG